MKKSFWNLELPIVETDASACFLRFFNSFFRFDHISADGIWPEFENLFADFYELRGVIIDEHNRLTAENFDGLNVGDYDREKLEALLISSLDDTIREHKMNDIDLLAREFKPFHVPNREVLLKMNQVNSYIPNHAKKMTTFGEINVSIVINKFCKRILVCNIFRRKAYHCALLKIQQSVLNILIIKNVDVLGFVRFDLSCVYYPSYSHPFRIPDVPPSWESLSTTYYRHLHSMVWI